MKTSIALPLALIAIAILFSGCTTKKTAKKDARIAYMTGRQTGVIEAYERQAERERGPVVTFSGPFNHNTVEWTEDLTLLTALQAAEHNTRRRPRSVFIHRGDEVLEIKVWRIWQGQDYPVEPGDHIELKD